jgi:hypothetical protein
MKAFLMLAVCGAAAMAGCQVSGDRDVDTTRRPSARVETSTTTVDRTTSTTAGYTMAYQATRDTEWAASTDASAARGTLQRGDRVMFMRTPDASTDWQQARLPDGTVRYVRPADFRPVTMAR